MFQPCCIVFLDTVVEMLCDKDTAVHPARTADGDHELAFSLLHILRQEKIDEVVEMFLKLLCHIP